MPCDQYGRRIIFPAKTVENVLIHKRQPIVLFESYSSSSLRVASSIRVGNNLQHAVLFLLKNQTQPFITGVAVKHVTAFVARK